MTPSLSPPLAMPPAKSATVRSATGAKRQKGALAAAKTAAAKGALRLVPRTAVVKRGDVGRVVVVEVGRRRIPLEVDKSMVGETYHKMIAERTQPRSGGLIAFRKKRKQLVERSRETARARALQAARTALAAAVAPKVSVAEMLEAGLLAFREVATRWQLTNAEQCALLQVSESSLLRWRKAMPTEGDILLDRLQLVLLTYQRVVELAGSDSEASALVRRAGSALNAEQPQQTVLEMLAVPSILEMHRHVQRLEGEVHAW